MTSVNPGAAGWSFYDHTLSATDKVDAAALDTQVDVLWDKVNELLTALEVTIRDDNQLEDEIVRLRCLHPEVISYIGSGGAGTDFIQGTLTTGTVPVCTGSGTVGDSIITQGIGYIEVAGALNATSLGSSGNISADGGISADGAISSLASITAGTYVRGKNITNTVQDAGLRVQSANTTNRWVYVGYDDASLRGYIQAEGVSGGDAQLCLQPDSGDVVLGNPLSLNFARWNGLSFYVQGDLQSSETTITAASTTARAGLRVPHGVAPTSPVNGDLWTTTAGVFVRVNGSTVGPLPSGSGTSGTIAKWTGSGSLGDSLITDDGSTVSIPVRTNNAVLRAGTLEFISRVLNLASHTENAYFDGTNWKYRVTGRAFRADIDDSAGGYRLFRAASGTAGATISWTQQLQILATGEASLGASAPTANSGILQLPGASSLAAGLKIGSGLWAFNPLGYNLQLQSGSGQNCMIMLRSDDAASGAQFRLEANHSGNKAYIYNANARDMEFGTNSAVSLRLIGTAGDLGAITFGKWTFSASSTTRGSINLPHGTAPSAPVDGDFWTTTAGMYARINGVTIGPFTAGSGGVSGSGTTGKVPKFTAASALGDSSINIETGGQVTQSNAAWAATVAPAGGMSIDCGHIEVCGLNSGEYAHFAAVNASGSGMIMGRMGTAVYSGKGYLQNTGSLMEISTVGNYDITVLTDSTERMRITGGGIIQHKQANCPTQYVTGTIWTSTANRSITNTVTETSLFAATGQGTLTLPANCLIAGRTVRIKIQGDMTWTGTPTLLITVKLGANDYALVSGALPTLGQYTQFDIELYIQSDSLSVGAQVRFTGKMTLGGTAWTANAPIVIGHSESKTINNTGSMALDVTAIWGTASGSNSIQSRLSFVELLG